jgi:hypothetical protein
VAILDENVFSALLIRPINAFDSSALCGPEPSAAPDGRIVIDRTLTPLDCFSVEGDPRVDIMISFTNK